PADLRADRVLADSTSLGELFERLAELDDTNCLILELEKHVRVVQAFWGGTDAG
ncbi:unnamed protein product, partial [marine sediment metagenome]